VLYTGILIVENRKRVWRDLQILICLTSLLWALQVILDALGQQIGSDHVNVTIGAETPLARPYTRTYISLSSIAQEVDMSRVLAGVVSGWPCSLLGILTSSSRVASMQARSVLKAPSKGSLCASRRDADYTATSELHHTRWLQVGWLKIPECGYSYSMQVTLTTVAYLLCGRSTFGVTARMAQTWGSRLGSWS
jgi:hypothetical protein